MKKKILSLLACIFIILLGLGFLLPKMGPASDETLLRHRAIYLGWYYIKVREYIIKYNSIPDFSELQREISMYESNSCLINLDSSKNYARLFGKKKIDSEPCYSIITTPNKKWWAIVENEYSLRGRGEFLMLTSDKELIKITSPILPGQLKSYLLHNKHKPNNYLKTDDMVSTISILSSKPWSIWVEEEIAKANKKYQQKHEDVEISQDEKKLSEDKNENLAE